MPVYTYTEQVVSIETVAQNLITVGLYDAKLLTQDEYQDGSQTGKTVIKVDTTGADSLAAAAINASRPGELSATKSLKIAEISAKSSALLSLGVDDWAGLKVALSKSLSDQYYTDYGFFAGHAADPEHQLSAEKPYIVLTLDGRSSETSSLGDILTLSHNAANRMRYVYANTTNDDGSKGQNAYIKDILAAQDVSSVNAITDTRV